MRNYFSKLSLIISINFYTYCFSLTTQDLTKKLFAGPAAAINNNYPYGKSSVFRKIKFNNQPDLTGIRLDFIDEKGNLGKRNYWYLTAADINGEVIELKGCFKYKIQDDQLVIDLYKTDNHSYQSINVRKKLDLGDNKIDLNSWIIDNNTWLANKNVRGNFNKAAILKVPLTDDLLTKQVIFLDSNLTNLNNVLGEIGQFGAPYHILTKEDCVVGELSSIGPVNNLLKTYYSVLEKCAYLTMRYMHRELTPATQNIIVPSPTMYNNK